MDKYEAAYKNMEPNFIAMGRLMQAWDHVESACALVFEALVDHHMSQRIFFSSSIFSSKKKLIERCLEVAPETTGYEDIERALVKADKLSGRRNDIVHGQWVNVTQNECVRIAIRKDHDDSAAVAAAYLLKDQQKLADRAYTSKRMISLANEMQELAETIFALANNLLTEQGK